MKKSLLFFSIMFATIGIIVGQTVIFSDNFDNYTAGGYLAQQATGTSWTTWTNAPGTAEDGTISNAQSQSAPNSLFISGSNDVIYSFANLTNGHYTISFDYYVASTGNGAYFNIQHSFGSQWAFAFYLSNSGTGNLTVSNVTHSVTFTPDTWFNILIDIDLDNDLCFVNFGGTVVHTWSFSEQESNTVSGINQLACLNFFSSSLSNSAGTYYVDNFTVTEVSAALVGHVDVSIDEINTQADISNGSTSTFDIENTGTGNLDYRIVSTYDIPNPNSTSTGEVALFYYVDEYTSISFNSATQWEGAIGFPADAIAPHIGKTLNKVDVMLSSTSITNAKVRIYGMEMLTTPGPGELLYEQTFTPIDGWNSIILNTPVLLDGSDLWISIWIDQPLDGGGIGCDGANAGYYGNWISSGITWARLVDNNSSLPYSWCIKGYIDGTPINPWMELSENEGSLTANSSQEITVTFDPTGTSVNDTKTGDIHIMSNDFDAPEVEIDVTVTFAEVSINNFNQIEIEIYPNPASDFVKIEAEQISQIDIFNLNGQLVYSEQHSGNNIIINTQEFAQGTYFVRVSSGKNSTTKKIVIQ